MIDRFLCESGLGDLGWQAAIKAPGNVLLTADAHQDAWTEYIIDVLKIKDGERVAELIRDRDFMEEPGYEEGFIDPSGNFLTREQAMAAWRKSHADQIRKVNKREWGDSEDLHHSFSEIGV